MPTKVASAESHSAGGRRGVQIACLDGGQGMGRNRTGVQMSPFDTKDMLAGHEKFAPDTTRSRQDTQVRLDFADIAGSSCGALLPTGNATDVIDGITVTLIDSIVAGRSAFGCSMDYRSVVVFSNAERITDPAEKERIADAFVEGIIPGHKVRRPKPKELGATLFLRFPINEASAKIRDVGVLDVDGDYELDLWAGRIPLRLTAGEAQSCARLKDGIEMPDYAKDYQRG